MNYNYPLLCGAGHVIPARHELFLDRCPAIMRPGVHCKAGVADLRHYSEIEAAYLLGGREAAMALFRATYLDRELE